MIEVKSTMSPTGTKSVATARILLVFEPYMRSLGLPVDSLLRSHGIDPAAADDLETYVDLDALTEVFEDAAAMARDSVFGLHLAEWRPMAPAGIVSYLIRNAPSLRQGLRDHASFNRLVVNGCERVFEERATGGRYVWRSRPTAPTMPQFVDFKVTLLVARIRLMLRDPEWMPRKVTLPHKAPRSRREYHRVLGQNVEFETRDASVTFDQASLDRRFPGTDAVLYRSLRSVLTAASPPIAVRGSIANLVRSHVMRAGTYAHSDAQSTAEALGLSVRSLQRALADEGFTFRSLAEETRKNTCLRLLRETEMSLTEVAFALGFSELSAFSRAARKWFGAPAGTLRTGAAPRAKARRRS